MHIGSAITRWALVFLALMLVSAVRPAFAQNYTTPVGDALVAEIENFRGELEYDERNGDSKGAAWTRLFLARLYYSRVTDPDVQRRVDGDLSIAIDFWSVGLEARRELGIAPKEDWTDYINLTDALLLRADGYQNKDLSDAILTARLLYESISPDENYLSWLTSLSTVFRSLRASQESSDWEEAIVIAEQAIAGAGFWTNLPMFSSLKFELAGLYLMRRDGAVVDNRARALALYQEALEGLGDDPAYAELRVSFQESIQGLLPDHSAGSSYPLIKLQLDAVNQGCRNIISDVDAFIQAANEQGATTELIGEMAQSCVLEARNAASSVEAVQYRLAAIPLFMTLASIEVDRIAQQDILKQATEQLDLVAANMNPPAGSLEAAQIGALRSMLISSASEGGVPYEATDLELLETRGGSIDRVFASSGRALLEFQSGRWEPAGLIAEQTADFVEQKIGIGLNEQETRRLLDSAEEIYRIGAKAWIFSGDPARSLRLLDRGRAQTLASSLQMDRLQLEPGDRAELSILRIQIAQQSEELSQTETPTVKAIKALESLRNEAEAIIESSTANEIATPAGVVLVAPVLFNGLSIIVQLPSGMATAYAAPEVDQQLLERSTNKWVANLRRGAPTSLLMSAALRDFESDAALFGEAIGRALSEAGVEPGAKVVMLVDGRMSVLPVHLLRYRGQRLSDIYPMTLSPSIGVLAASQSRANEEQTPSLISFANPTNDPALKHAEAEAILVAGMFPADKQKVITSQDADLSLAERAIAQLANRSYWHFSTHGVFDWQSPIDSGLMFAAGTVLRVSEVRSAGGVFQPRLVVLSACETGLSDPRRAPNEFQGLPSAFLQAGASGVIASLWSVSDFASAILISKVYELHLGDQKSIPAEALQDAQDWLRGASRDELQDYILSHEETIGVDAVDAMLGELADLEGDAPLADPYYWGAWVYFGA